MSFTFHLFTDCLQIGCKNTIIIQEVILEKSNARRSEASKGDFICFPTVEAKHTAWKGILEQAQMSCKVRQREDLVSRNQKIPTDNGSSLSMWRALSREKLDRFLRVTGNFLDANHLQSPVVRVLDNELQPAIHPDFSGFVLQVRDAPSPSLNVFPAVTPRQRLVFCSARISQRMWGCSLVLLLNTRMYGVLLVANSLP